jgi:predicted O-linked N-acetylglucosamine transferase (SPINDLY family)
MWMGVPVVTLAGRTHSGRVGVSLLSQAGLTEQIANSPDEYVDKAVQLAGDPDRLARLRADLRPRLTGSSLCDGKSLARSVEAAYRGMWEKWCAART